MHFFLNLAAPPGVAFESTIYTVSKLQSMMGHIFSWTQKAPLRYLYSMLMDPAPAKNMSRLTTQLKRQHLDGLYSTFTAQGCRFSKPG